MPSLAWISQAIAAEGDGMKSLILIASLGAVTTVPAFGQTSAHGEPVTALYQVPRSIEMTAQGFVANVAQRGIGEVAVGRLASGKSRNTDVRGFSDKMVLDHSKANDELKAFADRKHLIFPADTDAKHKDEYERLNSLSRTVFDKAYVAAMIRDHEESVAECKRQVSINDDSEVRAWAARILPTLEGHLREAKALSEKLNYTRTP